MPETERKSAKQRHKTNKTKKKTKNLPTKELEKENEHHVFRSSFAIFSRFEHSTLRILFLNLKLFRMHFSQSVNFVGQNTNAMAKWNQGKNKHSQTWIKWARAHNCIRSANIYTYICAPIAIERQREIALGCMAPPERHRHPKHTKKEQKNSQQFYCVNLI